MGVVLPEEGFLPGLRKLCDQYGALLIFDEVITGFRLAFGGAAEYFHVKPDMVTYGKIIGAGMPVGAYGGRKEIMEMVSPVGPVYQAGTLSGNPVAMAAGLTQLRYLRSHPEVYRDLETKGGKLYGGMEEILRKNGLNYQMNHVSSLGSLFFTGEKVKDYASAKSSDTKAFARYFLAMLKVGIHLAPSQFEAMFLSAAHDDEAIDRTLMAAEGYFSGLPVRTRKGCANEQITFGRQFTVTTWGESHGKALGAVIDGCPAGLPLAEEDIQKYLDRRKPGQSRYTTARKEGDLVEILSGRV